MERFTVEKTRKAIMGIPMTESEFEGLAAALIKGQTKEVEDHHLFRGQTGRVQVTAWSPELLYAVVKMRLEPPFYYDYGPKAEGGIILLWRAGRAMLLGFLAINKVLVGLSVYKHQDTLERWLEDLQQGEREYLYFYFGSSEDTFPSVAREGTQEFQKIGEAESLEIAPLVMMIWDALDD